MGRSVSNPSAARVVAYAHLNYGDEDGEAISDELEFDSVVEDFRETLKSMFPSVEPADEWIGREDHVLAENKLARFGISEYCGLVAYWIVPAELGWEHDYVVHHLSDRWIDSIADKFTKAFGTLTKTGTMSNGEGVYAHI